MKYPIAIEPGDDKHAYGIVVPDLPGCFSGGDTLDEAMDNAREAIELWLETVIDDGGAVPEPRPLAEHQKKKEFKGWVWAVVAVDLATRRCAHKRRQRAKPNQKSVSAARRKKTARRVRAAVTERVGAYL